MKAYRISRKKNIQSTLDGIGAASSAGNRWNSLYTPMVYTAESRALAILEMAVHLDLCEDLPSDQYILTIEIPDVIIVKNLNANELPPNWDAKPPLRATQVLGDQFIKNRQYAVLKVPSSIVPNEFNYLINPAQPEVNQIKVTESIPFVFDDRLKQE